jgi:hypothetical protein
VEQTPQEIQQFRKARDRRYERTKDIKRLTSTILGKGLGSDTTDYSKKRRPDGIEDESQTKCKSFENRKSGDLRPLAKTMSKKKFVKVKLEKDNILDTKLKSCC